jgi:hypothetical protein
MESSVVSEPEVETVQLPDTSPTLTSEQQKKLEAIKVVIANELKARVGAEGVFFSGLTVLTFELLPQTIAIALSTMIDSLRSFTSYDDAKPVGRRITVLVKTLKAISSEWLRNLFFLQLFSFCPFLST